jgi:hypothetical protein
VYARSLVRQVRTLFEGSSNQGKVLRETAIILANEIATRFSPVFDTDFVAPMLKPLLSYDGVATNERTPPLEDAAESVIEQCVTLLHLLLCGPPPSAPLVLALVPVFRPLVHLYAVAVASKSFLAASLQAIVIGTPSR